MMGFIHAVYPAAEFAQRAQAFAAKLAALPAETIAVAKLSLRAAMYTDRASARDFDRLANTLLVSPREHSERMQAFAERSGKRKIPPGDNPTA